MKTILTIWTKPRKTFDYLDKQDFDDIQINLDILFFLGALGFVIPYVINEASAFRDLGIGFIIIGILFGAFIAALSAKFIYVFLFWIAGRGLQGKATQKQIRVVMAYFMVPGLINLLISIILIIIAIIFKDIEIVGYQNPGTQIAIWIFGIRTLIIGLSKYNDFSYGYAIINIVMVTGFLQGLVYGIRYLMNK